MNKYEKFLRDSEDNKEKVLQILKILDGETYDDIQEILNAAKYFANGCSQFSNNKAEDWIESL